MNRDDILRMAREAGFELDCCSLEWHGRIERFAAIVAVHSLVEPCCQQFDKCQKVCMPRAAAAEREACAKVCEQSAQNYYPAIPEASGACTHLAAAVRARGQA